MISTTSATQAIDKIEINGVLVANSIIWSIKNAVILLLFEVGKVYRKKGQKPAFMRFHLEFFSTRIGKVLYQEQFLYIKI